MKFFCTFFKQYNCIYRFDIFITEFFLFFAFYPFVLTQQQICGITGTSLARKIISYLLYFHISNTAILQLHNDVCDNQGTLIRNPD